MANPLDQFQIKTLGPTLEIGGMDISFTNSALWIMIAVVVSSGFLTLAMRRKALIPGRAQVAAEMLYAFIAGMIRENIGTKGQVYFPLIFTLYIVVLMGNLLGLLPYSFTYTSHLVVTAALALMVFLAVLIVGFFKHGLRFCGLFCPPGVPLWLFPLIIPLEIISFLARPITLSMRLFANMMAGHLMLKVFAGFSAAFIGLGIGGIAASILPMLFNSVLIAFELLIALIHAYVFAVLSCIYLKDTVDMDH